MAIFTIGNLLLARSGHSLSTCTCGRRARRLNGSRTDFAVEFDCAGLFRPPRSLTWPYIRCNGVVLLCPAPEATTADQLFDHEHS